MANAMAITVPNPFLGVDTVGFSVRYPDESEPGAPPADVPIIIEGDAERMRPLAGRLRLFPRREWFVDCDQMGEAYTWTDPIALTDEVLVIAFRDRSGGPGLTLLDAWRNQLLNRLVPLAFPFLRDCVRIGQLRLSAEIEVAIQPEGQPALALRVPWRDIVPVNGSLVLSEL
ncbi:MAG TPA: hypothetical protein VNN74_07910 [Candidatus Micrarchaeia archaeon]|nr:hypothetical protein [Candidatus Micrarchaeia archaeon]